MTIEQRFTKALTTLAPVEALRALALEFSTEGFDKAKILEFFEQERQRLRSTQQESAEDAIMDAMDFLVGWCSPQMKLFFDKPGAPLQNGFSIYLHQDVAEFMQNYAKEKNLAVEALVNQWLRQNIAALP